MRTWPGSTSRPDLYLVFIITQSIVTKLSDLLIGPVSIRLDNHISRYCQMVLSHHLTRLTYKTRHFHK
ncbi:hypothetical protein Hanom_Chr15g01401211 [Helianthus anomalus]